MVLSLHTFWFLFYFVFFDWFLFNFILFCPCFVLVLFLSCSSLLWSILFSVNKLNRNLRFFTSQHFVSFDYFLLFTFDLLTIVCSLYKFLGHASCKAKQSWSSNESVCFELFASFPSNPSLAWIDVCSRLLNLPLLSDHNLKFCAGGLSQEGRILELYGNGQTVAQSIFQSSCREDVRDKPCRFLDKKVRHHSICAQKYSYSYALVREFGNPEVSPVFIYLNARNLELVMIQ